MSPKNGDQVLKKLAAIDFSTLNREQKLEYLRAVALCYIRTEQAIDSPISIALGNALFSKFPMNDYLVDVELSKVLTRLQFPGSLEKILVLMESAVPESNKVDMDLIAGNDSYGKAFEEMMKNQPNAKAIQFAIILMNARNGWNDNTVARYFKRINEEEVKSGGASYTGFITNIKKELVANLAPNLQEIANKAPKAVVTQEQMPIAKGPGRTWTMEDAIKETADLSGADSKNGAQMYKAVLCSKCHIMGVSGGDSGPNLTNLATRFGKNDILKAILHPSEEISEQYHFEEIEMTDGSTLTGKILDKNDKVYTVAPSAFDLSVTMEIEVAKVKSVKPSKNSPMPAGLINALNPSELRDLMKYLTNQ
jgi:putative heme-binding domain-containing protein